MLTRLIHKGLEALFEPLHRFGFQGAEVVVVAKIPGPTTGLTFGRVIYVEVGLEHNDGLLRHEYAHVLQYRRYGVWGFLLRYLWAYLIGLWRYGNHRQAYLAIPFEVEAREAGRGEGW